MNINDFEGDIEDKILARGKNYYADGLVDEIWLESNGSYHAVVDGSEPYEVEIVLADNGDIKSHDCDCPYDWGEYCKHEVAVLLSIRAILEAGTPLPNKRQKKNRGLRALLEKHTKKELISLMCELSREYGLREEIEYYFDEDEWGE